jgi:hypothetical protein
LSMKPHKANKPSLINEYLEYCDYSTNNNTNSHFWLFVPRIRIRRLPLFYSSSILFVSSEHYTNVNIQKL